MGGSPLRSPPPRAAGALGVLMFSLGGPPAQERMASAMRTSAPAIKRWGGLILVLVGVCFVVLGAFAGQFAGIFSV